MSAFEYFRPSSWAKNSDEMPDRKLKSMEKDIL